CLHRVLAKRLPRGRQSYRERRPGTPVEVACCPGGIDDAVPHITRSLWGEARVSIDASGLGAETVEFADGGSDAAADVVDTACSRGGRRDQRGHDVAHVDEVAGLFSVAEDLRLLPVA